MRAGVNAGGWRRDLDHQRPPSQALCIFPALRCHDKHQGAGRANPCSAFFAPCLSCWLHRTWSMCVFRGAVAHERQVTRVALDDFLRPGRDVIASAHFTISYSCPRFPGGRACSLAEASSIQSLISTGGSIRHEDRGSCSRAGAAGLELSSPHWHPSRPRT